MNALEKEYIKDDAVLDKKVEQGRTCDNAPKGRVYALPPPSDEPDARGSFEFGSPVVGATRDGMKLLTQDGREWQGVKLEDGSLCYDPIAN